MKFVLKLIAVLSVSLATVAVLARDVVEDEGVGLSRPELEYLVQNWTPDMQQAALNDPGDRIELLSMALANKKLAARAASIPPEADPEAYWRLQLAIRNLQSQFVVRHFLKNLDIPDMSDLAAERYLTQKDRFAFVPEERYSSQILLVCPPGACDREPRREEAKKLLAELDAGADFSELATKYSEDGSGKVKGGKFDRWLKMGDPHVAPRYLGGLFAIEEVGDHSDIVETKFGLHIIRLDDIKPAYYKSYDEVKEDIIATLEKEYVELQARKFDAGFRLSDSAYIDNAAVEEILESYGNVP